MKIYAKKKIGHSGLSTVIWIFSTRFMQWALHKVFCSWKLQYMVVAFWKDRSCNKVWNSGETEIVFPKMGINLSKEQNISLQNNICAMWKKKGFLCWVLIAVKKDCLKCPLKPVKANFLWKAFWISEQSQNCYKVYAESLYKFSSLCMPVMNVCKYNNS